MKNNQTNDIEWDLEPRYSNRFFKIMLAIIAALSVGVSIFLTSCNTSEKLANKRFNQAMQASKPITAQNCINSFPIIPKTETKVETVLLPGETITKTDTIIQNGTKYINKYLTRVDTIRRDSIIYEKVEQTGYITITKNQDKLITQLTTQKESLSKTNRRLVIVVIVMGIFIVIAMAFKFIK